jgi:hypothetical protein
MGAARSFGSQIMVHPVLPQFHIARPASPPLPPKHQAQAASEPRVKFPQHRGGFAKAKVAPPTGQIEFEAAYQKGRGQVAAGPDEFPDER